MLYTPPSPSVRIGYGLLDLADGLARVQVFRARFRAVHDRVASVQLEGVVQSFQAFLTHVIPRILDPPISLQDGRPKIRIGVPPIRRARCATTRTKNTLVHPI